MTQIDKNSPEFKAQVKKIRAIAIMTIFLLFIFGAIGVGAMFFLQSIFTP